MQLLITFTVLSYLIVYLEASGLFRVYLISFRNSRSWDSKHRACDYFSPPCDTKFEIKLWSSTFPTKVIHTREYSSQDSVNFEINYNPITLHVSNYRGYMNMYVYVKDIDPIGYDKINSFNVRMSTSNHGIWYYKTWNGDHGHTPLYVKYIWSCNSNYYGSWCNVYCSSTSRYYCNSRGSRVCRPGWLNPSNYCNTRDYCYSNECKNGGRCQNGLSGYSCSCINGYHGTRCEKSPCYDNPCMNGGKCSPSSKEANYYVCDCPMGFLGDRCEIEPTPEPYVNPCLKKPCLNGGNCHELINDTRGFECHCSDKYTGELCETFVPICERQQHPCLNHGECVQNSNLTYSCNCTSNYTGFHCGHLKCGTLCYNGGRCNEINGTYQCVCAGLYTGFSCKERKVKKKVFPPLSHPQPASRQFMRFSSNNNIVIYILVAAVVVLIIITVLVVFILHKKRVINVGETYQRLRHNSVQFYDNYFRRGSKQTEFHVNMTYDIDANSVYDEIQGDENNDNYYSQNRGDVRRAHVIIGPIEGQSKEPNSLQASSNAALDEDPEKSKDLDGSYDEDFDGISVVDENKNVYEDENSMNNIRADAEQ